jgi:MFS family permease
MARKSGNLEDTLHDQPQLLDKKNILFVFALLALCLLVCFIDQNGIGVILPPIARDLNAQASISWAGTSALIANTVFQVLYGRLSDLFGRKNILVSALLLLSLSDLACGLSVNSTMLYIFRGLAGVANGGITSLTMMIVSDIVTLQDRGKYQGILGSMVGLGNALGPLIASAFAIHSTWRGLFYLLAPLIMLVVGLSWTYLPSNMPHLDWKETIGKIDFLGLFTGTAAVILLLIPISEGGHQGTPWDSAEVIAMLCVGGTCFIAFLLVEWKWARLPIMPLDMFKIPSVAAMLAQSFFLGASYYSYLYFLPL